MIIYSVWYNDCSVNYYKTKTLAQEEAKRWLEDYCWYKGYSKEETDKMIKQLYTEDCTEDEWGDTIAIDEVEVMEEG